MGYNRNNTIVITGSERNIHALRKEAVRIFDNSDKESFLLVSNVVPSGTNAVASFFIAPDGNKEGWDGSNWGDEKRDELVDFLRQGKDNPDLWCDWVEVQFGDDEKETKIVRDSDH